jgi:uncharacterized protein YuzB (UPF0349 family)
MLNKRIGTVLVEVCMNNPLADEPLAELEEEFPEVVTQLTDCLGNCELCAMMSYALVNLQTVMHESSEECMKIVREAIVQEIAYDEI